MPRVTPPRLARAVRAFLETEASGGSFLLAAAVVAMLWANLFGGSYDEFWSTELRLGAGRLSASFDLRHWVNDGLMTVFFLVVGLEIKRELVEGELRDRRAAVVPVIAAAGGMIGPAVVYLSMNTQGPGTRGWGIPMATDIAFALGVLAVAGRRATSGTKVFLLTLAIVDDIGAIAVIAIAYTEELSLVGIGLALAALVAIGLLRRLGVRTFWPYLIIGAGLWGATAYSGVHPTIAGVALGLMTPAQRFRGRDVLDDLQERLHPISSYVIVPLFALANAGIALNARSIEASFGSSIFRGVVGGLVIGKFAGILLPTILVVRLTRGRLPSGMQLRDVAAVAILGGIGFTVAIFIAELALADAAAVEAAKMGILVASVANALLGGAIITVRRRTKRRQSASKSTRG